MNESISALYSSFVDVNDPYREEPLDSYFQRYINAKQNNTMRTYKYKHHILEHFGNDWVLTRDLGNHIKRVKLTEEEIELIDLQDIEGSLPEVSHYVDFIKNRIGM
ncbi:MAG: hypothetical protein WBK59_03470 [Acholeplasmatales bacterium]|jgi:hypothetical protein